VRGSYVASRSDSLECPLCEASKLYPSHQDSMRCRSCRTHSHGTMLETLRRISSLPYTLGSHACECNHPEMRLLPDRTYHCPACGSEVLPIDAASTPSKSNKYSQAYWVGWEPGRPPGALRRKNMVNRVSNSYAMKPETAEVRFLEER